MAHARETSARAESLVAAVTELDAKTDSKLFSSLRDLVLKKLKTHSYPQTDYFGVTKSYDGLEEKFAIRGRDDLSTALRDRVAELSKCSNEHTSDILALFLYLADNPVQKTSSSSFDHLKPAQSSPPVTWQTILDEEPFDETGIWESIDYAEDSDIGSLLEETEEPSVRLQGVASTDSEEKSVQLPTLPRKSDAANVLKDLAKGQFWARKIPISESAHVATEEDSGYSEHSRITETQAIRECLFMLRGLPTSLFAVADSTGEISVDEEYALCHTGAGTFRRTLLNFATIGESLYRIRLWASRNQRLPLTRSFQSGVESRIRSFDAEISNVETDISNGTGNYAISLIEVYKQVNKASRLPLLLSNVVRDISRQDSANEPSFVFLEFLFDEACRLQMIADDEAFRYVVQLFFDCFTVYLRPVRSWIREGKLDTLDDPIFFIKSNKHQDFDLSTLWHDQFVLKLSGKNDLLAPRFLQPVAADVLNAGKSFIFLAQLKAVSRSETASSNEFTFSSVFQNQSGSLLIPFQELFNNALSQWIAAEQNTSSGSLCKTVFSACDLSMYLEALEVLYFCKDGGLTGQFAQAVFNKIDRRNEVWNDRFLLTELARTVYGLNSAVESERISIRSTSGPYGDIHNRKRTVKIFSRVTVEYKVNLGPIPNDLLANFPKLPWPILNIVPLESLKIYQSIALFLIQILRAKFMLEQLRLAREVQEFGREGRLEGLFLLLRQRLLWLVNVLYSHFVECLTTGSSLSLRHKMATAHSMDAMIKIHRQWIMDLESQCLLTNRLAPLQQSIISILDLAILFADVRAGHADERSSDITNRSFSHHASHLFNAVYKKRARRGRGEEPDEQDSSDESERDVDTSHISFTEKSYGDRLVMIQNQLNQMTRFLTKGLRGVSRATGESTWDTLAEKLEWYNGNHEV